MLIKKNSEKLNTWSSWWLESDTFQSIEERI